MIPSFATCNCSGKSRLSVECRQIRRATCKCVAFPARADTHKNPEHRPKHVHNGRCNTTHYETHAQTLCLLHPHTSKRKDTTSGWIGNSEDLVKIAAFLGELHPCCAYLRTPRASKSEPNSHSPTIARWTITTTTTTFHVALKRLYLSDMALHNTTLWIAMERWRDWTIRHCGIQVLSFKVGSKLSSLAKQFPISFTTRLTLL